MIPLGATSRLLLRDGCLIIEDHEGRVVARSGVIATLHLAAMGDQVVMASQVGLTVSPDLAESELWPWGDTDPAPAPAPEEDLDLEALLRGEVGH